MHRLGQYTLEHQIARGGMGAVFEAYDERLGRQVALKVLRREFARDAGFRARFIQESRAAAALDHPNILPVFDAGEEDGILYIATRLVDGVDLREHIEYAGGLSIQRSLSIVGQIAAALDFAHARGIVHRDIKPGNVLIVDDAGDGDHAYLIDFGITTTVSRNTRLTATGRFVGTPAYMSPEQLRDIPVDGRADQYGLACVLFECLTGSTPFPRTTMVDILHAHLHELPPAPSSLRPGTPAAVDEAVARALSKDPEQRFRSCRGFVAAARGGSAPTTVTGTGGWTARGAGSREAGHRTGGGTRMPVVAIAAVVLGVAAAGALAATQLGGDGRDAAGSPTTSSPAATSGGVATTRGSTRPPSAPRTPKLLALHPDAIELRSTPLEGYHADLPADWHVDLRDAPQLTEPGVTRLRTSLSDRGLGTLLLIDALTGYDVTPERNRAQLDEGYRRTKTDYERIGFSDYDLGGTHAYEWRYRYTDGGADIRRADIIFSIGSRLFAVLAGGPADYGELATLAHRTAASITLDEDASRHETTTTAPAVTDAPAADTYAGIGYQHSATGAVQDDDYRVTMTFDDDDGGSVDYPDLGCGGSLSADGFDGTRRVYDEQLDHGTCSRGGSWRIRTLSSDRIEATWTVPSHRYAVKSVLTR